MIKTSNRNLRRLSLRLGVGIGIFFVILGIAGARRLKDLGAARQNIVRLNQEIDSTRQRVQTLQREVENLNSDDEALERFAREDLGMVRPGDVVIIYD